MARMVPGTVAVRLGSTAGTVASALASRAAKATAEAVARIVAKVMARAAANMVTGMVAWAFSSVMVDVMSKCKLCTTKRTIGQMQTNW